MFPVFPLKSEIYKGAVPNGTYLRVLVRPPPAASGFIEDRCFRADGFIIRAKATIRINGFFVGAGLGSAAAGQPRIDTDQHHPYQYAVSK